MGKLWILKAGDKLPALAAVAGDYEDWITAGLGAAPADVATVAIHRAATFPPLHRVAGVVITGSGAMVTDRLPWMLAAEQWLREAVTGEIPVLGLCFGHQLLAQALGGEVGYNPHGVEVGTVEISLSPEGRHHPLFAGMPAQFPAQVSHRQTVLIPPPGARVLAASVLDAHQAFAVGRCAVGLQFHPEFDHDIVRAYARHFAARLKEEGKDPAQVLAQTAPSPQAHALLARFWTMCRNHAAVRSD